MRDVIIKARELISDERNWCTGAYCKTMDDEECDILDGWIENSKEYKWCAVGAVIKMWPTRKMKGCWISKIQARLNSAANELFSMSIHKVNDVLGHKAVLRVYDHIMSTTPP